MIKVINGDLLKSDADLILHQVNCQGRMGSGIALQIGRKYSEVYGEYQSYLQKFKRPMGKTLFCDTHDGKVIGNMFGQNSFGKGKQFTNYSCLRQCLEEVRDYAEGKNLKIGLPYKMSCDRGGGDWDVVYKMIEETIGELDVTIYKLEVGDENT